MKILRLPFVYTILARRDLRFRYRKKLAIEYELVKVPEVFELPEPVYTVSKPGDETLHWRYFNAVLMRPVIKNRRLATLTEIETEQQLWSPTADVEWFCDHPSAFHVLPQHPPNLIDHIASPELEKMLIKTSDRKTRVNAIQRRYADSVVCGNHLYVPSPPPTWAVTVSKKTVRLACDVGDRRVPSSPTFYFDLALTDAVEEFLKTAKNGRRRLLREKNEVSFDTHTGRVEDGALATARCLANGLFRLYGNKPIAELPSPLAYILAGLKHACDNDDEVIAHQVLSEIGQLTEELLPTPFDRLVGLLDRRNHIVNYAHFGHALDNVRL